MRRGHANLLCIVFRLSNVTSEDVTLSISSHTIKILIHTSTTSHLWVTCVHPDRYPRPRRRPTDRWTRATSIGRASRWTTRTRTMGSFCIIVRWRIRGRSCVASSRGVGDRRRHHHRHHRSCVACVGNAPRVWMSGGGRAPSSSSSRMGTCDGAMVTVTTTMAG